MNLSSDYFNHETERLILRRLQISDIECWQEFFVNNPSLQYLGLVHSKETKGFTPLDWSKKWIDIQFERYQQTGFGHLAVISKETGKMIGMAGILQKTIEDKLEHEIAYSLIPQYWGIGYASEMSAKLVEFAIEERINRRIISIIHVDNAASKNVAQKNGMSVLFRSTYSGMDVDIFARNIR